MLDPPARMSYDSKYAKVFTQQDNTFNGKLKIIIFVKEKFFC